MDRVRILYGGYRRVNLRDECACCRMEDSSGGSVLRDDRSDSGVSSLRSAGSGDERSGSRSSALSPTPPPSVRKIAEVSNVLLEGEGTSVSW